MQTTVQKRAEVELRIGAYLSRVVVLSHKWVSNT